MPAHESLYLSLSEILSLIESKKEDLQRQSNQGVRKHSPEGQIQSLMALGGMDALDDLLYLCRMRAGQFAPETAKSRADAFEALKRSQLQLVGKRLRKKAGAS